MATLISVIICIASLLCFTALIICVVKSKLKARSTWRECDQSNEQEHDQFHYRRLNDNFYQKHSFSSTMGNERHNCHYVPHDDKTSQAASRKYENIDLDVLRSKIQNIEVHNYDEIEIHQMETSTIETMENIHYNSWHV